MSSVQSSHYRSTKSPVLLTQPLYNGGDNKLELSGKGLLIDKDLPDNAEDTLLQKHQPTRNSMPENIVPTTNITSGRKQCPFKLPTSCQDNICHGSLMEKPGSVVGGTDRSTAEIWAEADEYIREYYQENKLPNEQRDLRLNEIQKLILDKGYYTHTYNELSFGVKTAWRNSRRCVMRSQWSALFLCRFIPIFHFVTRNVIQTIDRRDVTTSEEMLDACFDHLRVGHNAGRIRPTMTIFPQKLPGRTGPRIWNHQLTRYAAYRLPDGTIIGDSANLELTDVAIRQGWTPKYGRWDILPLIVSAEGEAPTWRDVPEDCYKEVKISHPTLPWFEELDLQWTDHPPVSAFVITIGGVDYCAAPFSGWYLGTEVAARNLGDEHRYNALPEIATRLGLPMNNRSLWRDRAVVELNHAILYSFDKAKVTIIDHHSASDSFVAHYEKEIKTRGHCPADWVWLTPPSSSSTTTIFHQEMYSYLCKPAVIPLSEKPWDTYFRETGIDYRPTTSHLTPITPEENEDRIILAYGTETGTSERYTKKFHKYLRSRMPTVQMALVGLDDLELSDLQGIVCIVTSSFGEGEPPSNAIQFRDKLNHAVTGKSGFSLLNFRYAVLGLGSTNYTETYQNFPRLIDRSLASLKARRIIPLGELDDCDAAGSEDIFENWIKTLAIAIEVGTESTDIEPADSKPSFAQTIDKFRTYQDVKLSRSKPTFSSLGRDTYHVELATCNGSHFKYLEGDHISILPNSTEEQLELVQDFVRMWGQQIINNDTVSTIINCYVDLNIALTSHSLLQKPNLVKEDELSNLIRSLPLKSPRMFSISSSPAYHPSILHIAIARLEHGQLSVPLTSILNEGELTPTFQAVIRTSTFHLPEDLGVPVILVGCGTGVGPLRGMMHGRLAALKGSSDELFRGPIVCFTGFRAPQEHFYLAEFTEEAKAGRISHYPAYSRFDNQSSHVGDLMYVHSTEVAKLLGKGGVIFICGSHVVRGNVEEALLKIGQKELGLSEEYAQDYLTRLKRERRFMSSTYSRTH
ncbi:hypothetical protein K435DRAFT_868134 [Dendrothele bispora CBS 962.96]|uniref:nitric-oxide synthase (NADPH) n=1 Tax=Dendrothele bispora (strain CBS 962.96) TaxID=1314807 RepID=A0A4S8LDY0_DENBC|nr:hypothetical protein K435DRAFT_868134 [Dendrothele bispora CBS 962.96]